MVAKNIWEYVICALTSLTSVLWHEEWLIIININFIKFMYQCTTNFRYRFPIFLFFTYIHIRIHTHYNIGNILSVICKTSRSRIFFYKSLEGKMKTCWNEKTITMAWQINKIQYKKEFSLIEHYFLSRNNKSKPIEETILFDVQRSQFWRVNKMKTQRKNIFCRKAQIVNHKYESKKINMVVFHACIFMVKTINMITFQYLNNMVTFSSLHNC